MVLPSSGGTSPLRTALCVADDLRPDVVRGLVPISGQPHASIHTGLNRRSNVRLTKSHSWTCDRCGRPGVARERDRLCVGVSPY